MAIKIKVAPFVAFRVEAKVKGEDGQTEEISFGLKAKRKPQKEINRLNASLGMLMAMGGSLDALTETVLDTVVDGSDFLDESGAPLPFSRDVLAAVLDEHTGLTNLVWKRFLEESEVKEKN